MVLQNLQLVCITNASNLLDQLEFKSREISSQTLGSSPMTPSEQIHELC